MLADVRDHGIVKRWRFQLLDMAMELSCHMCSVHKALSLHTEEDKDIWAAACNMDRHIYFTDVTTWDVSVDACSFVKKRLEHVINCLGMITGVLGAHLKRVYTDRWVMECSTLCLNTTQPTLTIAPKPEL